MLTQDMLTQDMLTQDMLTQAVKKLKTNILPSITFFPKYYAFYGIMWENLVEPDNL
jgi:hypothetical protein